MVLFFFAVFPCDLRCVLERLLDYGRDTALFSVQSRQSRKRKKKGDCSRQIPLFPNTLQVDECITGCQIEVHSIILTAIGIHRLVISTCGFCRLLPFIFCSRFDENWREKHTLARTCVMYQPIHCLEKVPLWDANCFVTRPCGLFPSVVLGELVSVRNSLYLNSVCVRTYVRACVRAAQTICLSRHAKNEL